MEEVWLPALLGGGVSGAVLGALASLIVQRRQHQHEDRHRFTPIKRGRYADILHESANHVEALSNQRAVAASIASGEAAELPVVGTSNRLRWLAEEIAILSPAAGARADELYAVIGSMHASFAVDAKKPHRPIGSKVEFGRAVMEYEAIRREFIETATKELGTAP